MFKKTALFSRDGFPYFIYKADIGDAVDVVVVFLVIVAADVFMIC